MKTRCFGIRICYLLRTMEKGGTVLHRVKNPVGCCELLAEKVLNIVFNVKGVDFLYLCNAWLLFCVDQKIQGVVVISLDRWLGQPSKQTVQFEPL